MVDFLKDNISVNELPEPLRLNWGPPPQPLGYGIELRGALALFVTSVRATPVQHWPPLFHVSVSMTFPERMTGAPTTFVFEHDCYPEPRYTERGLYPIQAAIAATMKWLWEHEFKEGLLFNGIHATSPDEDHHR